MSSEDQRTISVRSTVDTQTPIQAGVREHAPPQPHPERRVTDRRTTRPLPASVLTPPVPPPPPHLDDYGAIVGQSHLDTLRFLAKDLKGKTIKMVNSTAVGGGVAEMLNRLVPLLSELEVATHWDVITGLYDEYARKQALYEEGKLEEPPPRPVNRAYSNVVGWIGPWSGDDMRTGPVGRILHGEQSVVPVGSTQKVALGLAALEYTTEPADPSRIARVAVDLGSAIPERNPALEKVDVGTLAFASAAGGQPTVFARVPYPAYAKDAYEQGGGVVEFAAGELLAPLTAEDLQAPIVVLCEQPAGLVQQGFAEAEYTAETDDRGVYLDEPGTTSDAATMTVQVRYRGGSPPIGTQLQVEQYTPTTPGFNEDTWGLVSSGDPHAQSPYLTMSAGGAAVVDGAYLTVALVREPAGPDSWPVTVSLGSIRPGPAILRFRVFAPADPVLPPPPSDVQWPNLPYQSFANARVLPFHNTMAEAFENWLRAGPSVDLVTQRVFDAVFRTFFLMYPAMRFLRDPLQFQAWRGRILAATDPGAFETAAYMPVTRSLSAGQRRILELWDTYLDGTLPTPRHSGEPLGRRS